jgi:hypothetical protein
LPFLIGRFRRRFLRHFDGAYYFDR